MWDAYVMPCWDETMTYTSEKWVRVRDVKAAGLYYALCALILGYVGYNEVYVAHGYLAFQTISGSVRGEVTTPRAGDRDLSTRTRKPSCITVCSRAQLTCSCSLGHRAVPESLPYCVQHDITLSTTERLRRQHLSEQYNHSWWSPKVRHRCIDSGKDIVHFAHSESNGLLVGTRVTAKPQLRNATCPDSWLDAPGCAPWVTSHNESWRHYFVGDIESSGILLQHTVTAGSTTSHDAHPSVASSFGMNRPNATIIGDNGTVTTRRFAGGDELTMRELLSIAGVDLDAHHPANQIDDGRGVVGNTTLRFQGVSLVLAVACPCLYLELSTHPHPHRHPKLCY